MKILHVIHSLTRGGLENGLVNLVNLLPESKFEHAICCLDSSGEMADRLEQPIEIFELNRKPHDWKLPVRLAKVIRQWQPDIVHCRNWNSWFDTVVAHFISRSRSTMVWSFHGFAEGNYFPLRRKVISKLLSLYTQELFAVCEDSARRYAKKAAIPVKRFEVLYNGVDSQKFRPNLQNRPKLREQLNIPVDRVVIITVASLTPIKNHSALIDSIHMQVTNHGQSPLVLFLGDGALREALEEKISRLNLRDHIKLLGNSDNIPDYLAAADIFVLPSRLEGMSNAILEAMASGLPAVANNVGGNSEIIVSGETGFLCTPDDPTEMAELLGRLINERQLRKNMGRHAHLRVEQLFSIDAMTASYQHYYEKVFKKYRK